MGCPACGAEVVHPNRTAKERGLVDCPSCDWDGSEDETTSGYASSAEPDARRAERSRVPAPPLSGAEPGSSAVLGGALLGAAAGLALLLWARRR